MKLEQQRNVTTSGGGGGGGAATTKQLQKADAEASLLIEAALVKGLNGGRLPTMKAMELIQKHGLTMSLRTMQGKLKNTLNGGSIFRKRGTGLRTKYEMYRWAELKYRLLEYAESMNWRFDWRSATEALTAPGDYGSKSTLYRIGVELGIITRSMVVRPLLTKEHERLRFEWAVTRLRLWGVEEVGKNILVFYLDESWVKHYVGGLVKWMEGLPPPVAYAYDKRYEVKFMFIGVFSRPIPECGHDGTVGLWLVTKSMENDDGEEVEEVETKMTTAIFHDILKKKIVPAVLDVTRRIGPTTRAVIQFDNASAHGGGRGDIQKKTIRPLDRWAANEHKNVNFRAQSPRSPETNLMDLGVWTAFQSFLNKARVMPESNENKGTFRERFGRLIPEVLEKWKRTKSMTVMESIHAGLKTKLEQIVELKGGNGYGR
jgi:hypothetical protein